MSVLGKRLLGLVGLFFLFAGLTAVLVFSVSYKPYGVPDHLREEYETKVAILRQRETKTESPVTNAKPIVNTGNAVHDFGKVDPHQTLSHEFTLSNDGDAPLHLTVRETSCKCTVGKLGVPVVLPGETTSVTMEWNTGFMSEEYEQTALIKTNDPKRQFVQFKVKGTIRADLVIPESVKFTRVDLGEVAQASFVVFSQLWDDFAIKSITPESEELDWYAEPLQLDDESLKEKDPKAAWKVVIKRPVLTTDKFDDTAVVRIQPGDGSAPIEKSLSLSGETRRPIAFLSPEIKAGSGLDLGTMASDKDHHFHLTVQVRGEPGREIKVLDVVPDFLQTELQPGERDGYYKLTLTVPKGVSTASFNRDDKRGYVEVGDPHDQTFQNWFPLYGAVVKLQ